MNQHPALYPQSFLKRTLRPTVLVFGNTEPDRQWVRIKCMHRAPQEEVFQHTLLSNKLQAVQKYKQSRTENHKENQERQHRTVFHLISLVGLKCTTLILSEILTECVSRVWIMTEGTLTGPHLDQSAHTQGKKAELGKGEEVRTSFWVLSYGCLVGMPLLQKRG